MKKMLTGMIMGASALGASAQDYRVAADYQFSEDQVVQQYTLGFGEEGIYDQGNKPSNTLSNFLETGRLYYTDGSTQNLAGGIRYNTENTNNIIFGSVGDTNGLGLESRIFMGDTTLTGNVEIGEGIYRLGGQVAQQFDDLNLALSYDTANGDTHQVLLRGIYDFDEQTAGGLGLVGIINPDQSTTLGASGFLWHRDENPDTLDYRVFGVYSQNQENDSQSFSGQLIFGNDNLTIGKPGAIWTVDRGVWNDELYNISVLPISIAQVEAPALYQRSTEGTSVLLGFNTQQQGDTDWLSMTAQVGHRMQLGEGYLGVSAGPTFTIGDIENTSFDINAGYQIGNWELDGGVRVEEDGTVTGTVGLQRSF